MYVGCLIGVINDYDDDDDIYFCGVMLYLNGFEFGVNYNSETVYITQHNIT